MRVYTTNKPRTANGVMQYAKADWVDVIDFRQQSTVIQRPGLEDDQIDATLVSSRLMPNGQYLYIEDYAPEESDPDKRNAIFEVKNVSPSHIGRHQYSVQFKENHAA